MKIQKIEIRNYCSLHNLTIHPKDILALVGRNNSGKSNVLKARELFFEGTTRLINDECFYNHKITKVPEPEWLREDIINGDKITEWWSKKEVLKINGLDFSVELGTSKPKVREWKEAVRNFIDEHRNEIPWKEERRENPTGYAGVLKGALPEFIHIPAVRDVSEETKVAKTNPFGQLINSVLEKISKRRKRANY